MTIDVVHLKSNQASSSLGVNTFLGNARLSPSAEAGLLEFPVICPTDLTVWMAAEMYNISNPATDAIRIRFRGASGTYYIDTADNTVKPVTATDWGSDFSLPYALGLLSAWTDETLQIIVFMMRTDRDPNPGFSHIYILVDHPVWKGVVHQTLFNLAEFVGEIQPILIHEEVVQQARAEWKIGGPTTEHGYQTTELVRVALDNRVKSAVLVNGAVQLIGPPAQPGQKVKIAVKYKPSVTVRRVEEIRVIHSTPAWLLRNLVVGDGLVGTLRSNMIGGYEVSERAAELRVNVQGIAHRTSDANAMRLALQNAFAPGFKATMPTGRCVHGSLNGPAEVMDDSAMSLPMAQAQIGIYTSEFVFASLVRRQIDPETGGFQESKFTYTFPDGNYTFLVDVGAAIEDEFVIIPPEPAVPGPPVPPPTVPSSEFSWFYLVSSFSSTPLKIANTTSPVAGAVFTYTLGGVTRYRLVPNPYVFASDAFYTTWNGTSLSGLIVSRA